MCVIIMIITREVDGWPFGHKGRTLKGRREKKTSTKDVYWATTLLLSGSHSPAHLTRLRKTNFAPLLEEEKRVAATVRRAGH